MVYSQISDISSLCLSPLLTLVRLSDPEGLPRGLSRTNILYQSRRCTGLVHWGGDRRVHTLCIYSLHLHVYCDVILIAIILCHVDVDIYIPAVNLEKYYLMTYAWRYQELYMKNGPNQGKMKIIWISPTYKFLLILTNPRRFILSLEILYEVKL